MLYGKISKIFDWAFAVSVIFATVIGIYVFTFSTACSNQSQTQNARDIHQDRVRPCKGKDTETLWDKTTADPIALYTFWLAVFTSVLAIVSGIQIFFLINADKTARLSADAAKKSADAAIKSADVAIRSAEISEKSLMAANRPWITVDIAAGGPITYNVNGVNFTILYILKNTGNSPATRVNVDPKVFAPAVGIDSVLNPPGELKKLITETKGSENPFGYALFPEQTVRQLVTVTIPTDELKRVTQKINFICPMIIGTVSYRSNFDNLVHQTTFMFDVRRSDAPRPISIEKKRSPSAIFIDEGDIPTEEIRLIKSFWEGGYAD